MSSFYPPPPPTRRDLRGAGGLNAASRVGLPSWALSKLKLLVRLLSDKQPDTLHLTLGGLVMFVAGLVMLRIMSALPPQGKAFVVNIGAFAYPALTTTAELGSGYKDKLPAYSYYWVSLPPATTDCIVVYPSSYCTALTLSSVPCTGTERSVQYSSIQVMLLWQKKGGASTAYYSDGSVGRGEIAA